MKVQYIGKQKPHRERLYGTRTLFAKPGDIQDIDDQIAKKMINNHPDQYGTPSPDFEEQEPETKQVSLIEDGAANEVLINGELVPLTKVSKDVLIDIAKRAYEVEIPSRTDKAGVIDVIGGLIAKHGQPEG